MALQYIGVKKPTRRSAFSNNQLIILLVLQELLHRLQELLELQQELQRQLQELLLVLLHQQLVLLLR